LKKVGEIDIMESEVMVLCSGFSEDVVPQVLRALVKVSGRIVCYGVTDLVFVDIFIGVGFLPLAVEVLARADNVFPQEARFGALTFLVDDVSEALTGVQSLAKETVLV
jgi:hypothetical protein